MVGPSRFFANDNREKVQERQALENRDEIVMLADDLRDVRAPFPQAG